MGEGCRWRVLRGLGRRGEGSGAELRGCEGSVGERRVW